MRTSLTGTPAFFRAASIISDWRNGTVWSTSPWMSRDGAASADTWLIGDAAQTVLYSTEVFGVDSITLTPRNNARASPARLGLIRRRSSGAARATMHWTLALSRLTGSASLASPGPPRVP